ncbi:MAG: heat-shock protein Hsp20 [Rhodospirillaceae bacterium]|nr:heat-shock protein Hsp20 [Rhodospirillaceae bacterium]|tara:strand:+ start:44959 stop:45432 length:474 start_codon:yes stop_codon:yes gene_type:complete
MSRISLFNSPFLLGFDELENLLDRTAKASSDGYPPYNIEQVADDGLRISLAVAGFNDDELSVVVEDRQLIIKGKQSEDEGRVYLHRGIAARQFQRSFVLAEGIEVTGAALNNGLLHVDLIRPKIETRKKVIKINTGDVDASSDDDLAIRVETKNVSA